MKETISPPRWIRIPVKFDIPDGDSESDKILIEQKKLKETKQWVRNFTLNTVCEEACCPNLSHCWGLGTATFLIMGDRCTRRCKFCNIKTAKPFSLDPEEPHRLAVTVKKMRLKHVVITSVDRDDLKDCGSQHFAHCIREVKNWNPDVSVEVLIPDFKAKEENMKRIVEANPEVVNHNIETVPSLYKNICPQSNYTNSLKVLEFFSRQGFLTKTGIILGLGESLEEVLKVIQEAREVGTHILTIGQYLQPSKEHIEVQKFYSKDVFESLKAFALELGYWVVEAGPLVRSSFHAGVGIQPLIQKFYEKRKK